MGVGRWRTGRGGQLRRRICQPPFRRDQRAADLLHQPAEMRLFDQVEAAGAVLSRVAPRVQRLADESPLRPVQLVRKAGHRDDLIDDAGQLGRVYHFRQSWIRHKLKASPSQLRIMHVEGDSMAPTLLSGDAVLVDMTRRAPNPPGIFVLDDGMGLVAKRLEHIPNSDPPAVRVISDNKHYPEYERTADEIHIVGRIRWFAREI